MIHKSTAKKAVLSYAARIIAAQGEAPSASEIAKDCALPLPLVQQFMGDVRTLFNQSKDNAQREYVGQMYAEYLNGKTQKEIAIAYSVTQGYVSIMFAKYGFKADLQRPRKKRVFKNPVTVQRKKPSTFEHPWRKEVTDYPPKPPLLAPPDEKVYEYIRGYIAKVGLLLTPLEVRSAFLLSAHETHDILQRLESAGRIQWNHRLERGISVPDMEIQKAMGKRAQSYAEMELIILQQIDECLRTALAEREAES